MCKMCVCVSLSLSLKRYPSTTARGKCVNVHAPRASLFLCLKGLVSEDGFARALIFYDDLRGGGGHRRRGVFVPDGKDDAAFTADEPAVGTERDIAQCELDVGVNTPGVDEREFEDVGTLTREWIGDWTSSRADAEEGAIEEELRRRYATRHAFVFQDNGEIERDAEGDAGEADGPERAEVYGSARDKELASTTR